MHPVASGAYKLVDMLLLPVLQQFGAEQLENRPESTHQVWCYWHIKRTTPT